MLERIVHQLVFFGLSGQFVFVEVRPAMVVVSSGPAEEKKDGE